MRCSVECPCRRFCMRYSFMSCDGVYERKRSIRGAAKGVAPKEKEGEKMKYENNCRRDLKGKKGWIIAGIIIAVIVLVMAIIFIVPWVILFWEMFFSKPDVDRKVSHYSRYFGEAVLEKYSDKWGIDDSIFPEAITEDMDAQDFIMVYYNPFDAQYLSYLVVSYEDEAYEQEMERLQAYESTEYLGNYGATGFAEQYDLVAMNADDYQGFVYALSDGEDTIVYVELLFCNFFYDLDYTQYIPDEYLPIGFDATQGNEYGRQQMAKLRSLQ